MAVNLTAGAVSLLLTGQPMDLKPVLQIIDIRIVQAHTQASGTERYRVMLSDGEFHQQGMLATQRNDMVRSQQLQKGSVVQLTEFVCNAIRDRIIIIIVDLNVILSKCDIIGNSKPFIHKQPGNEASSMARSDPPVQLSHNQPATTVNEARSLNEGTPAGSVSVTRLNSNASAPVLAQCQNSSGSHTYSNAFDNNPESGPYSSTRATFMHVKPESVAANNRTHPIQAAYNQPPPMYGNRGPMAKNEAPQRIMPIAALNPYQGKWTIRARVTVKGELRHYNNAKGDGKVFSFDLLDSDGGEIRATCFNAVADQFYNQIEVGKVYYISRGSVKPAQKAYNHLKNDYEITLDHTSTVQPCFDDNVSIPHQQYHFRSIGDIEGMDNNSVLDIIGVVSGVTPSSSIMRKTGGETTKRTVYLKDMSGRSIELTLWGNFCNSEGQTLQSMCDSGLFPILAVKSARVQDFNGKSIATISSSQLCIDPEIPEAKNLKAWFESVGRNAPSISMSRDTGTRAGVLKTVSQIKDEKLGTSEKPDWITVNATIFHIKFDNFCYTACPIDVGDRKCSKKVVNNGDGKWRCDRCDKTVDECDYRYILQLQIQDHTGLTWATAFQEAGEEIMGVPAKELYSMRHEEQDDDKFAETVRNVLFNQYSFKLKVKEDTFGEEQRVKVSVTKADKIKFSSNTKALLLELQKMHNVRSEIPSFSSGLDPQPKSESFNVAVPSSMNYSGQFGGIAGTVSTGMPSGGATVSSNATASGECYKCHQVGHWARDCPGVSNFGPPYGAVSTGLPSGGVNSNTTASGECYKCHQVGHWARDCPGVSNVGPPYGSESVGSGRVGNGMYSGVGNTVAAAASSECYKCHQFGHWARDCPGVSNAPVSYK